MIVKSLMVEMLIGLDFMEICTQIRGQRLYQLPLTWICIFCGILTTINVYKKSTNLVTWDFIQF